MEQQDLIPHLFRTEFRKIVSVLCKYLGIAHLEVAEDIASETFLSALETWTYKGIPEKPVAWLYAVAKSKAKNRITRSKLFAEKIAPIIRHSSSPVEETEIDLSEQNITDSQLQMLFAVCHPSVSPEAQIGLSLRILCGFGIEEIANALLTNKEAINKRLFRAREILRKEKIQIAVPEPSEINKRLEMVLRTLYLLFSEGYYSESKDIILRRDLCEEAMRLANLLLENKTTQTPPVNALVALMCFQASRFDARKNQEGELVLYHDQDESLSDQELIRKGAFHLHLASTGDTLSRYHLEAAIAYGYTRKEDTPEKWEAILQLFNQLLQLEYSPIAALNRTYAFSKAMGKEAGIKEAEKLGLDDNPYYHALLGELYTGMDNAMARDHFRNAVSRAKTSADKQILQKKIGKL
jgi:RNA polymerase sigma factor (sigma-70 family)